MNLLDGLGMRKLAEADAAALTNLLERRHQTERQRNVMVHGHWVYEANVFVRRGHAILRCQFLRVITPTDPEAAEASHNPRNQKERVRYCFTLKRIDAATRDTNYPQRGHLQAIPRYAIQIRFCAAV